MTDTIDVLERRVAALEWRLAPKAEQSAAAAKRIPGPARNARGEVIVANNDSYEDRQAAKGRERQATHDEIMRRRTQGLPRGQYRDDCGIVRNASTGQAVAVAERERRQADEVRKAQGDARRDRLSRTR